MADARSGDTDLGSNRVKNVSACIVVAVLGASLLALLGRLVPSRLQESSLAAKSVLHREILDQCKRQDTPPSRVTATHEEWNLVANLMEVKDGVATYSVRDAEGRPRGTLKVRCKHSPSP